MKYQNNSTTDHGTRKKINKKNNLHPRSTSNHASQTRSYKKGKQLMRW
jgi:hypothetical protein